ncbi:MAG TPA: TolC family protein [Bacteroidota bacterium]|nr:TolC family protein [Bacteroidota bacterium]
MKRTQTLILAALLARAAAPAHQGSDSLHVQAIPLTLERALALALDQNRDVLIAERQRDKAEAQVSEARSGALPDFSVSGNYTRNVKLPVLFLPPNTAFNPTSQTMAFELGSANAYSMNAVLSQPLFNWKVGLALDIADTYRDYVGESARATKEDVAFNVKKAFYGVLLARKLVEANRQGLEIVRANFQNVEALNRNGTAAEFDLLRAEVQLANTEPLLIASENNLQLATNGLKSILAIPLESEIDVQGELSFADLPDAALQQVRREAIKRNPTILSLSLQESILEKNIGVERANNFPTLNLIGAYQLQSQDNTFHVRDYLWANSFNVGLQLSVPIFDGFRSSARAEQATIDRDVVHYTRLKAEEGLRLRIEGAELQMSEAKKRIHAQEKTVSQAERAVHIAQTRYSSGVGTQLEVLDAQVALTQAQTNIAQALYDFLIARADWENAAGMMP